MTELESNVRGENAIVLWRCAAGGTILGFGKPGDGSFGLGKPTTTGFGLGKPGTDAFGLGKPRDGSFGLGKPATTGFGLGKPGDGSFGLGKPATTGFGLGKPATTGFGLGNPGTDAFGLGKPGADDFGLGKPASCDTNGTSAADSATFVISTAFNASAKRSSESLRSKSPISIPSDADDATSCESSFKKSSSEFISLSSDIDIPLHLFGSKLCAKRTQIYIIAPYFINQNQFFNNTAHK